MAFNRKVFFETVRSAPFGGRLSQAHVDNLQLFLQAWDSYGWANLNWLAYLMAAAYHETAHTFAPIEEYGKGAGRWYGVPDPVTGQVYYGRGFSQLTGAENYKRATKDKDIQTRFPGIDLYQDPHRALDADVATLIHFDGMGEGWFTGKGLGDYLGPSSNIAPEKVDFVNAYRILNPGAFKEFPEVPKKIAGYAKDFLKALETSQAAKEPEEPAPPPDVGEPELTVPQLVAALKKLSGAKSVLLEW